MKGSSGGAWTWVVAGVALAAAVAVTVFGCRAPDGVQRRGDTSYLPPFEKVVADYAVPGVTMTRGKPVQGGMRVELPNGITWQELADLSPAEIRRCGLWPAGFLPLPHPDQPQGGMVFPRLPDPGDLLAYLYCL